MTQKYALSVSEACDAIGIGRTRLYEEMATGRLLYVKCGKRRLIPVKGIEEFLANLVAEAS